MYVNCTHDTKYEYAAVIHSTQRPKDGQTHQRVVRLPAELLPQELDDRLEAVRRGDLVEVLLHNRCISNRFKTHNDYQSFDKRARYR